MAGSQPCCFWTKSQKVSFQRARIEQWWRELWLTNMVTEVPEVARCLRLCLSLSLRPTGSYLSKVWVRGGLWCRVL
jgi:hypothetical protein